ncbi:BolA domain UV induced protein Uvi31 [Dimargaris xerosporica]|nr:BolA domain UV induced protein Uvi31 [Dimargaris xerosporica]
MFSTSPTLIRQALRSSCVRSPTLQRSLWMHTSGTAAMASKSALSAGIVGPLETRMRRKIEAQFAPTQLDVVNESHLHAHHEAMRGVESKETHFRLTIVSSAFQGLKPLQRHRAVYEVLRDELNDGVHALSLKTRIPEE